MELLQRILSSEIDNLTSSNSEGAVNSRSDLLFLQSLYSTVTVVIIALPSFFHPYLSALLSSLWRYASYHYRSKGTHSKEQNGVMQTIDICVTTIGNYISPRMLLPISLASVDEVFKSGHEITLKFVQMLRSVAEKSERGSVVSSMSKWLSVSQALLDYRRAYGDHSVASEAVENAVHAVVCELCLKFTEAELKAFMTQLNDWKNKSDPREARIWTREARFVAYYGLQQRLLEKLQSLYFSTMALFWHEVPETLKYVAKQAKKVISNGDDEFFVATSSTKKRKRNAAEDTSIDDVNRSLLDELVALGGLALSCVHLLCASSEVAFITEVGLLPFRRSQACVYSSSSFFLSLGTL
ncbi:hypothetical protein EON65_08710 [archaeon]|nr:MAG: hypothetical protein EON65_08710 [archaeon]